jgi:heterodisulfide reductase subunit B
MKYAYYPGCASESTARDQHMSIRRVASALGIELIEPKGWICCGSTPAHQTDPLLATALPVANMLLVQGSDLDMVVSCASCYSRLKMSYHEMQQNPEMRKQVSKTLGKEFEGSVKVRHFIEVLIEDYGIDNLKKAFTRSLQNLKIACYYGCLLVRPPEVTQFDNPENPTSMDRLVEAMGGESLDWPHKVECCGGGFALSRPDIVVELSAKILGMAQASGAQCVAVACPMCQLNLDLRQSDINKGKHKHYQLPIVYISQLLGLCLGIAPEKLGMDKCMISPEKIIDIVSKPVEV